MMLPMALDAASKNMLRRAATRHRNAAVAADLARVDLRVAIVEARKIATVREIAEVTGLSFQRIAQIAGPKQ